MVRAYVIRVDDAALIGSSGLATNVQQWWKRVGEKR